MIAKRAYDRVEDQINSAPLPQAVVTAGVFKEKLLSGDATVRVLNLNLKRTPLPARFVIKTNQGSGSNLIVRDAASLD